MDNPSLNKYMLDELLRLERSNTNPNLSLGADSLMEYAIVNNIYEIVIRLVKIGFDLNRELHSTTLRNKTPLLISLHYVTIHYMGIERRRNYDMVKLLIENNADINLKGNNNITPMFELIKQTYIFLNEGKKIIDYFIENGADLNATNLNNLTPIHYSNNYKTASYLIQKGYSFSSEKEYIIQNNESNDNSYWCTSDDIKKYIKCNLGG